MLGRFYSDSTLHLTILLTPEPTGRVMPDAWTCLNARFSRLPEPEQRLLRSNGYVVEEWLSQRAAAVRSSTAFDCLRLPSNAFERLRMPSNAFDGL